jgi:hypothetical protein
VDTAINKIDIDHHKMQEVIITILEEEVDSTDFNEVTNNRTTDLTVQGTSKDKAKMVRGMETLEDQLDLTEMLTGTGRVPWREGRHVHAAGWPQFMMGRCARPETSNVAGVP